ncbi:mechanosensitive ion channel family protein [Microbispora sp. CA-102843]|uniref:mechanosensitive ion channel family protein n=1 Tax=Microbispora sp. CA-102843 TaxID=3239952 RepID=UPI003D905F55
MAAPVDWGRGVADAWSSVATFVPKFLAFVVVLVVGWLVAKALRKAVDAVLERVGFDRWVERGSVGRALARSKYDASGLLARLVYYAIVLITLQIAFSVFGPNPVSDLLAGVVAWLPKAAVAIVIIVVATAIARAVKDIVTAALGSLSYGRALATIASVFIIGLGVIAALNQIEVATTVTTPVLIAILAAMAGILIVGVGGGLVRPMQQRWERWLNRAEAETDTIRAQAAAYSRGRADAMETVAVPRPEQPRQRVGAFAQPASTAYRQGTARPEDTLRPENPVRPENPAQPENPVRPENTAQPQNVGENITGAQGTGDERASRPAYPESTPPAAPGAPTTPVSPPNAVPPASAVPPAGAVPPGAPSAPMPQDAPGEVAPPTSSRPNPPEEPPSSLR